MRKFILVFLLLLFSCEDKDSGSSMTKTFVNLLDIDYEFYGVVDGVNYTVYVPAFETVNFTFDCDSSPCDFDSWGGNSICWADSHEDSGNGPDSLGDTIYFGYSSTYIHLYHQGDAPREYFCPSVRVLLDE
jgi:hypothetical protein|tara:strand:+ start:124 stop:516 length:393 start_codon:yes stop_codon:yes gene_type:complete